MNTKTSILATDSCLEPEKKEKMPAAVVCNASRVGVAIRQG